jgi:hypothetical protein
MVLLLLPKFRFQGDPSETEEDHQYAWLVMRPNAPLELRRPPGKAVKPVEFVAPVFGGPQAPEAGWAAVLFNAPPATPDPPRLVSRVVHSPSVGTCQPVGHKPLLSVTA